MNRQWKAEQFMQKRDAEILRTLGRLRFVTTREITTTWFGAAQVARRRLQILSSRDLIRPHRRGIDEGLRYTAWRLTPAGVRLLRCFFPEEQLPEGLEHRLAEVKLTNLLHHEALNAVYLEFLGGVEAPCAEPDRALVNYRAARMRARADQVHWRPDGDVVLRLYTVAREIRVIPDATLTSRRRKVRVFVELDRSSKDLGRIRENLLAYRRVVDEGYRSLFPDGFRPTLLYVVRSKARQEHVAALGREVHLGALGFAVRIAGATNGWLEEQLVDAAAEVVERSSVEEGPRCPPSLGKLRDVTAA